MIPYKISIDLGLILDIGSPSVTLLVTSEVILWDLQAPSPKALQNSGAFAPMTMTFQ